MLNFMFGTLGSVLFWTAYFVIGAFVATASIKFMAKKTFSFLTGGNKHRTKPESEELHPYAVYTFLALAHLLLWPAISIVAFLIFLVQKIGPLVPPLVCKVVTAIDKMTPTIEFEKKEK